jgi:hypothetical protein
MSVFVHRVSAIATALTLFLQCVMPVSACRCESSTGSLSTASTVAEVPIEEHATDDLSETESNATADCCASGGACCGTVHCTCGADCGHGLGGCGCGCNPSRPPAEVPANPKTSAEQEKDNIVRWAEGDSHLTVAAPKRPCADGCQTLDSAAVAVRVLYCCWRT